MSTVCFGPAPNPLPFGLNSGAADFAEPLAAGAVVDVAVEDAGVLAAAGGAAFFPPEAAAALIIAKASFLTTGAVELELVADAILNLSRSSSRCESTQNRERGQESDNVVRCASHRAGTGLHSSLSPALVTLSVE